MFKSINGYEGLYEIDESGQVRSARNARGTYKGKLLSPNLRKGYHQVGLRKNNARKCYSVHRLVYEAFVGPIPEGYEINHKDRNRTNNHISNLETVTPKENTRHMLENGGQTYVSGTNHGKSKLTEKKVRQIREWRKAGWTLVNLGIGFDVKHETISAICRRKTWRHVA